MDITVFNKKIQELSERFVKNDNPSSEYLFHISNKFIDWAFQVDLSIESKRERIARIILSFKGTDTQISLIRCGSVNRLSVMEHGVINWNVVPNE